MQQKRNVVAAPETPVEGSLPAALERAFASRLVHDASGAPRALAGNVSREEALTLYRVVRAVQPRTSVEIGFAQGISTTAILKALADNKLGEHHVLDPNQRHYGNCGLATVSASGVAEYLHFHEKYAEDIIPRLPKIQFAFIDSSHLFDLTISEFVLVDKKLAVGGVIGFHDLWMPSLQKVLRYVLANRAYRLYTPPGHSCEPHRPSTRLKGAVAAALRRLPDSAQRLLAPDLLHPWSTMGAPSMAFIQKLDADQREWTFHRAF
jgi:predicted O-methyltransferase YrrM